MGTQVNAKHPFRIEAIVILPDHLHALWTLPEGDVDYPTRCMLIRVGFSRQMPKGERRSESRRTKGEREIWQRRYRERLIRDERDYAGHVNYIHYNPVKHGYVTRVCEYFERGKHPINMEPHQYPMDCAPKKKLDYLISRAFFTET